MQSVIENDHDDWLWTSYAAPVTCFFFFFFQNKGDFSVQILLIDDEPQAFLHGDGGPQVGEVTRLSI